MFCPNFDVVMFFFGNFLDLDCDWIFVYFFFFLTVAELIIGINDMDSEGDGLLVLLLISKIVVAIMPTLLLVAMGIIWSGVNCFFEKKIRVHVLTKVYTM